MSRNIKPLGITAAIVGGVLLSLGVATLLYQRHAPRQQFKQAQQTWSTQKPDRYRMTVEYRILTDSPGCQQEIEVQNEAIARVVRDTCQNQLNLVTPMTVSDIFARFQTPATESTCGPNGCQCDGAIRIHATYDAQLGYPRQIESRLERDWLNPSHWGFNTPCTMIGFIGEHVGVVSLEPLP
ncbi:hypothetical protein H6G89_00830 [Oscillatoria sp. FACHB-1407]|uniref:DUF6174 domain-containing protein n=1 Tax=Oscillatoria sp. FACHB-1407 TaxID=2692847 RepID=UPI001684E369|nr:DUF6174 domain-containing protein [Oscillatoria sp. FACHB-1407]MBD2459574.1 hypothetical protein [Oscillatoria sp. FACHB-1407]